MRHDHIPDATHGRGGRHRARRGAIVNATLLLLDERPMHGYELITELDARSDGRWRPSPGTMYPALGRMEKHGLVESDEIDDKKQFRLTDAGRQRLAEYRSTREDDTEPWNDTGRGHRGELRGHVSELVGQVRQIGRFGTADQIERAGEVLADAKRSLYAILATESSTLDDDGSNAASTDDSESGESTESEVG
jgi:DNA-binding PadR family transcriptional regulator